MRGEGTVAVAFSLCCERMNDRESVLLADELSESASLIILPDVFFVGVVAVTAQMCPSIMCRHACRVPRRRCGGGGSDDNDDDKQATQIHREHNSQIEKSRNERDKQAKKKEE